jgi:peptidoglycan/LPS O-acetylase OafA/YrhL
MRSIGGGRFFGRGRRLADVPAEGARRPASGYLSNLDALRAIAALAVVLFHIDLYSQLLARHVDSEFFRRAYLMVDLFFVLSGFVMSHVYSRWFEDGVHRGEARRFIVARIARVYPLHLLTLLYLVGIVIVRYRFDPSAWQPQHAVVYSPALLPQHVLLLHGMNTTPYASWNVPSWSISTEWWIYLVFPFLERPLRQAGPLPVSLTGATCFATYFAIMFCLVPRVTVPPAVGYDPVGPARYTIDVTYQYGFVRCAAGFVLGMLSHRGFAAGRWRGWIAGGPALLALAAGAAMSMHWAFPDPVTVAFFPLFVLSAAFGGKAVDAVLGCRALRRLGDWSYALYLIHIPLIQTLFLLLMVGAIPEPASDGQLGLLFLGYLVVTVALSGLVHRLVERPLRDSVKRWLSAPETTPC